MTKLKIKSGDLVKIIAGDHKGLEGKVYITFVVDVDGTLTDFKILRDFGFGTGEEAIRVVKNYNGWIPGEQRGRKVRCHYSLPINVKSKR